MLVRIVKDWHYPESFFEQTPKGDGVWDGIKFTEEAVDDCDYLIVLQRPPYNIEVNCPAGNAWLITQEPPVGYFRFLTKSFRYFDHVFTYYQDTGHVHVKSMQPVLPWHLLRSYNFLSVLSVKDLAHKSDAVTWITSSKSGFPGQNARMEFKKHLETSDIRYNLFGRGFTPIKDKFDGLFPARYALAIENYSTKDYWTEKIADSLLSWCLPFYWGAENIEEYFPSDSFIRIDIHDPQKALRVIRESIANNEWEKRIDAIGVARKKILEEYQFFPYVSKMIKEDALLRKEKWKMKHYSIPENPYPWTYNVSNHFKYYFHRVTNLLK